MKIFEIGLVHSEDVTGSSVEVWVWVRDWICEAGAVEDVFDCSFESESSSESAESAEMMEFVTKTGAISGWFADFDAGSFGVLPLDETLDINNLPKTSFSLPT